MPRHRRKKGPRANESQQKKSPNSSIPQKFVMMPDEEHLWKDITPEELRYMVTRYPHLGLRFPAVAIHKLLNEIDRLKGELARASNNEGL